MMCNAGIRVQQELAIAAMQQLQANVMRRDGGKHNPAVSLASASFKLLVQKVNNCK